MLLTHSLLSDKGWTIQSGDSFKQNFKGKCWIFWSTIAANSYEASIEKSDPSISIFLLTILSKIKIQK